MTSINYTTTIQTMGEASQGEALRYINYVERKLSAEYPGADVRVHLDNKLSGSVLRVSDDLDSEAIDATIQQCWNSMDWWNA